MSPAVHNLTKDEALRFVRAHAAVLDAPGNAVNPFASSVWVQHFIDQVAEEEWRVLAMEVRAASHSVMLLYRDLRAPGRCMALTNYYASLCSPLNSTVVDRRQAISGIVHRLAEVQPRINTLNVAPLDGLAEDTAALEEALSSQGWYVRRYFCFGNWYLPCDGTTFGAYMEGRDSQLRNTWMRKTRKLLAAGQVQIVTAVDDVEWAMDAYDAVYSKSWKKPEPYADFVRGWARICAQHGWLRLGIATVEDVPVAAQFWFTIDRRAYIFKLAYDESQSKWSAGTVLSAHMFQHALDVDRVIEIDYLTGDDAYKRSWMTHRRERVGLIACNVRTPRGLLAAAKECLGEWRARLRTRFRTTQEII